ncbi:hypothetical protein LGM65_23440 [Burkholderia anthina]|uniref:hypothetical protein n=1 Tax=Burkholderia anthina TaxID=179879 RepID=UPI001CF41CBA|nr:hypothetical protein [Burkholderia anthina]MCA8093805.1 hypothetical protein [Burkholderia anthina]
MTARAQDTCGANRQRHAPPPTRPTLLFRSFPGAYFSFRRAVKSDIVNDIQTEKIHHTGILPTVRQVTQNRQGNFSRSCLLTGSKRLRTDYLFSTRVSKIGRLSFDVTNSRRRRFTANRRRACPAWLSGHIAERDSVAAEFNFSVSNDITKIRSGIDLNSVGNIGLNYMTARFCKIFNNLFDLLTYKIIFDGLPSEPSNSCLQKPSNLPGSTVSFLTAPFLHTLTPGQPE